MHSTMVKVVAALCFSWIFAAHGFLAPFLPRRSLVEPLQMGIFDSIMKAFDNEEYSAPPEGIKASARHILVKSPQEVDMVMEKLKDGEKFANVAADFSTCPSARQGGSLGSFSPGTMVAEFDKVIFDPNTELGQVVGPVQTQFGYHLIVVDKRTGV
uniref:Peptidyl-prolyl cis-trans isomerase n=1 Tax=Amphora coffeiformis TaxID=265554 RepID=A0A7S3LEE1_9STRA|mmetsp:Transcript_3971/g.7637  ORF Transcript_3971/g.7637 Transcript_3971/m.7637 type:complete len:156 (+) Transcript_3971:47-514(+)